MEILNVLLPVLPWKHYRNISCCNENGKSICIDVKKLPSGKLRSAQFGERMKAHETIQLLKVHVHKARELFTDLGFCFQKFLANGSLLTMTWD